MAGLAAQDVWLTKLFVNGVDLSVSTSLMYDTYVSVEQFGSDYVKNHFARNSGGNLYKINNETTYKQTNEDENDWSDIQEMDRVLAIPPTDANYLHQVGEWINVDQWLTYIAFDTLMGNMETGPATGRWGDDYSLYSGTIDKRFVIIPRDLDGVMTGSVTRDIFAGYQNASGLRNLLNNPEVKELYYQKLQTLIEDVYNNEVLDPILDNELGSYVPPSTIQQCKTYIRNRGTSVTSQLNTLQPSQ
jgi:hypothetical protein